jgi:hypothetical protein
VLRRLPLLTAQHPHLAYKAAPFIRDTGEARRLIAAYRAAGDPSPLSLPPALNLGLISEAQAIEELFSGGGTQKSVNTTQNGNAAQSIARQPVGDGPSLVLPCALIEELWSLLRTDGARRAFTRNLSAFSGVITEDEDNDGLAETSVSYHDGDAVLYQYDADQDGVPDLEVFFAFGLPESASLFMLPSGAPSADGALSGEEKVWVYWEKYPAILRAKLGETVFFPPPLEYFYAPLKFVPLAGNGAEFLYPRRDPRVPRVSLRSLVSLAVRIERPGRSAKGAVEQIELSGGVPQRASETAGGRLVSETRFSLGQVSFQSLDMDMDGRFETIRRFRHVPGFTDRTEALDFAGDMESSESDWDGDGLFEYGEVYYQDGSIERSWDLDGDGRRERRETR